MGKQPEEQKLRVKLFWSPKTEKENFEGEAKSVTSNNKTGEFDILPQHTNFISVISDFLIIRTEDKQLELEFSRGVLEVANNRVKIFLEL